MASLFRLLRFFSFRHLREDPWRTVTVVLGVAIGASVFLSVLLAADASVDSFSRSMDRLTGKADYAVRAEGVRVPDGLFAKVAAHPAVESAAPVLSAYVSFESQPDQPFLLIGIDPLSEEAFRDISWRQEDRRQAWDRMVRFLAEPHTFILSRRLAEAAGLALGEEAVVRHGHNIGAFTVIGILDEEGLALAEGGKIAVCDIATVQEFLGLSGRLGRIDLKLRPWAGDREIAAVKALLPKECSLVRPHEGKAAGLRLIRAYRMNLSMLSFVSLFVGMFLVFSVISINAARRRHETAVLLCIGLEPRQVFLLFLAEGFFFGLVGWLVGLPLGLFLTDGFLRIVSGTITSHFVRVSVEAATVSLEAVVISLVLTVSVSVAAAFVPAMETARIPPNEALSAETYERARRVRAPSLALWGLVLAGLSFPVSKMPALGDIPVGGYGAMFMIFVGCSMLAPEVLLLFGRFSPPFMSKVFGQPGRLAASYVGGAVSRTAIAVGALVTAIALFVGVCAMVSSFRDTVHVWLNQQVIGDVFVRPAFGDENRFRDRLPPELVDYLLSHPDVEDAFLYKRVWMESPKRDFILEAARLDVLRRHGRFLLLDGDEDRIMERLLKGEGVVVSEVYQTQTGAKPGDMVSLGVAGVTRSWEILGVFRDYRTSGGVIFVDLDDFQAAYGIQEIGGANVLLKPEADAYRFRSEFLSRFEGRYALEAKVGRDLYREVLRVFDETFSITYVLMLVALIVAALGVATTLSLLIRERRRELGMLLAVGATTGQLRRMVVLEALSMGLAGHLVGLGCGLVLSYFLVFVINKQSFGWTFLYQLPAWAVALSLALVLAASAAAALPPANRAARMNLAATLKGEG
jgi:putative ABC transport system permease protein